MTKTTKTTDTALVKFFWNGVKPVGVKRAKLVCASPSLQLRHAYGDHVIPTQITWYAKKLQTEWPAAMRDVGVENNSDSMTDYFECDRIRVKAGDDLFIPSVMAWMDGSERQASRDEKKGNHKAAAAIRMNCARIAREALAEHLAIVKARLAGIINLDDHRNAQ